MIKLLNKKTGNIFVLPDVEAIRIKKEDRAGTYEILDSGLQQIEDKQVSEQTVQELVMDVEARAEQIEEEDKEQELKEQEEELQAKEGKIKENPRLPKVKEDTLDLDKINKKELVNMAKRLGLNANINEAKQVIIDRIKSTGIL
jgi:hypothetical protein